ncbi:3-hydroxybutyrate dehydrogenase [Alkalihalobacillus xiaoxiensis]|uniref:3-hydroxybutyrate dehydrogenase n=1 Tax=Shouchella xiaoxiensis TaxID=766895 RepID=A0ABS2SN27_9BACI|nr:3-hydroxybutyrate dehydrogenase [Shouchella xiaoxiensis]MBM7836931.1 3-hydroxybutyrate dehydrogenase [Shouchella xiaoxiensis]
MKTNEQVVLITGAASGIGYQLGERYASEGAKVVLTDMNAEGVKQAEASLRERGFTAVAVAGDVTKEADVKKMINTATDQFGRLDVLINNAGMQHVAPIEEFDTERYQLLINIMLVGPFMAIKHAMPIMKQQNFGRIINMSSINGLIGFAGKAAYNSAKHGIIGLSKVAALESAENGITVNCIAPGYIDTPLVRNQMKDLARTRKVDHEKVLEDVIYPLVPQKRLITVEEIASIALYLSSVEARGITGQTMVIDGGYTVQ